MKGFDDNYYTIQKIIYVVLKFVIALSGKYFFKKNSEKFQNWPNSRYENGIFYRFHNFSQFVKL